MNVAIGLRAERRSLKQVEVVHFESHTSEAIAVRLARLLGEHGIAARCATFEARTPKAGGGCDHRIIVFPIRGDERIPETVESWIRALPPGITHSLWVTGDFRAGQAYDRVAADEATRLLSDRGSPSRSAPSLVDTPIADDDLDPLVQRWVEDLVDSTVVIPAAGHETKNRPFGSPSDDPQVDDPALRKTLSLLPAPPRYALDAQGRCAMISFDDGAAYERSLLIGLTDVELRAVLGLLEEMSGLVHVGLPYAGLSELDVVFPRSVRKMDLRGNRFVDYGFIEGLESVAFVNLADCDLSAVPEVLTTLPNLHSLVIGKNRLTEVPEWFSGLRALQRLTLYRNQVEAIPGLAPLPELRLLNLGASPIRLGDDALAGLPELNALGLRLLGLERIPRFLDGLPSLRTVDISKNPVALGQWPKHPRIRFTDRMPEWAWDRA